MEFKSTPLSGLYLVEPKRFQDNRGYFEETYNKDEFARHIGQIDFLQDNESESRLGVLRGLHLQKGDDSQAKLIRVAVGAVYDVVVDLRPGSESFGKWYGIELSHDNGRMLFVPRGFAHGFLVLTPTARFVYKVDNKYAPQSEVTINYNDSSLAIDWPVLPQGYILSEKDKLCGVSLEEYKKMI